MSEKVESKVRPRWVRPVGRATDRYHSFSAWIPQPGWDAGKTPFELIYGGKADLTDLPVCGAVVWVQDISSGKLGVRAKEGRWLGCDGVSDGSRIYWKERHGLVMSVLMRVLWSMDRP